MRTSDMLGLPVWALWQQKSRTLLTTSGVVFGGFVLAASLSIGQGVQEAIGREARREDSLRRISIQPQRHHEDQDPTAEMVEVAGEMSDAKRARIRKAIVEYKNYFRETRPRAPLTRETLRTLAEIEHVEAVEPNVGQGAYALLDQLSQATQVTSARPNDAGYRRRLIAGRFFDSSAESAAVVSEFLLYRLGLTDDADVEHAVGKTLRLEIRPYSREPGFGVYLIKPGEGEMTRDEIAALDEVRQQLPAALERFNLTKEQIEVLEKAVTGAQTTAPEVQVAEFPIIGVTRLPIEEDRKHPWENLSFVGDEVILPVETGTDLFFRVPEQARRGVYSATVLVDKEEHVKQVFEHIKGLGFEAGAFLEYIDQQRLMYLLIFGGMTCVAAVALVVAALGISNTMLMSVLERTREIGIMKAVGAGNAEIVFIFLVEGALIGLIGGALGLLLAVGASYPGDAWVRTMVARDLRIELKEALFVFPPWMVAVVILFAVLVTTLAAVYPARRAAKVDPVAALRHE